MSRFLRAERFIFDPTILRFHFFRDSIFSSIRYVAQFRRSGFRGGVNMYRNIDANWRIMARFAGARIQQPALFIGGDVDGAIPSHEVVERTCRRHCADLRGVHFVNDCSHFCAEQAPEECNALLLPFLLADEDTTAPPPAAVRL